MPADQDKEAEEEETMFEIKSQIGDREGGQDLWQGLAHLLLP